MFCSCCGCSASALHPVKWHYPQRTAEFNKAWNSKSSSANGQILHPAHCEHRDVERVRRGMVFGFTAGIHCSSAFEFLPGCPRRSTSSRITTWVQCYSVTPDVHVLPTQCHRNAVALRYLPPAYKTFCFPLRHFLQGNLMGRHMQERCRDQCSVELFPGLEDHSWKVKNRLGENHCHHSDFQMLGWLELLTL